MHIPHTFQNGFHMHTCDRTFHMCVCARTFATHPLTETKFQQKNLVIHSMGYFFNHKRAPLTKFAAKYSRFLDYFCRSVFNLKTYIPLRSRKTWENLKNFEEKSFGFGKKNSAPIPKLDLGFGLTLFQTIWQTPCWSPLIFWNFHFDNDFKLG